MYAHTVPKRLAIRGVGVLAWIGFCTAVPAIIVLFQLLVSYLTGWELIRTR